MNSHRPGRTRILLASSGTEAMLEPMRSYGHDIVVADLSRPSTVQVRLLLQSVEIVLVDVSLASRAVLTTIHDLAAVIEMCDVPPRLLCFATAHRNGQFALAIENCGARYARVADPPMLLEAIDVLLADIEDIRKNRPSYLILHSFALDGGCREGESVEAVLFPRDIADPQLRLALTERLTFDFLAQHPRLSFDARQIAAALNALPFYCEHGANAGVLQRVKVRVPAIKVIVGRIRHAMTIKFNEAHLQIDPFEVLKSFRAAGTNRVLYKLHADCRVIHSVE